jgi:hypothetical protein
MAHCAMQQNQQLGDAIWLILLVVHLRVRLVIITIILPDGMTKA